MQIAKVGVIGCGLMGSGIAETCARSGFETIVREVNDELLQGGLARLEKSVGTAVSRGKLTAEQAEALRGPLARIRTAKAVRPRRLRARDRDGGRGPGEKKRLLAASSAGSAGRRPSCAPQHVRTVTIVQQASGTRRRRPGAGAALLQPAAAMPLVEPVRAMTHQRGGRAATGMGQGLGKT